MGADNGFDGEQQPSRFGTVTMQEDSTGAKDQITVSEVSYAHRGLIPAGRQSLYASKYTNSIIGFINPFHKPPKRMNVVDNAPVNTQYISLISERYWQGEVHFEHMSKLLNPYEWACISVYNFKQPLQDHLSVFLVPNSCHMAPYSNFCGRTSSGSLAHHRHEEVWIALLFAAKSGRQFWLWMAKKESELLSETQFPSLQVRIVSTKYVLYTMNICAKQH